MARESNNYPISEFRVSSGTGVWLENNKSNFFANRPVHPLYNDSAQKISSQPCKIDQNFKLLVSTSELSFFTANNYEKDIIENIPHYLSLIN